MTIAKKDNGQYDISPLGSLDGHSIACTLLSNGTYQFMVYSENAKRFVPSSDGLMSILLHMDQSVENDIYDVFIGDVYYAVLEEGASTATSETSIAHIGMLEIIDGLLGDVNGDGHVTVTDMSLTVNYILGERNDVFIKENADMNGDGDINVADVMNIVLYILNQPSQNIQALGLPVTTDEVALAPTADGYALSLENAGAYSAFQMNVRLPQGCSLGGARMHDTNDGHRVDYQRLKDGSWNVVVWSMTGESLPAGTTLVDLLTDGTGHGTAHVREILLSNSKCESFLASDVTFTDGIEEVTNETNEAPFYNLNGAVVENPQKGVYVRNGKKVVVK